MALVLPKPGAELHLYTGYPIVVLPGVLRYNYDFLNEEIGTQKETTLPNIIPLVSNGAQN